MSGVTLTPMVGDDRSIMNALCIITTIAATHFAVAWLKQRLEQIDYAILERNGEISIIPASGDE